MIIQVERESNKNMFSFPRLSVSACMGLHQTRCLCLACYREHISSPHIQHDFFFDVFCILPLFFCLGNDKLLKVFVLMFFFFFKDKINVSTNENGEWQVAFKRNKQKLCTRRRLEWREKQMKMRQQTKKNRKQHKIKRQTKRNKTNKNFVHDG